MGRLIPSSAALLFGLSLLFGNHFLPWTSWHSEAIAFLAVFLLGWNGLRSGLHAPYRRGVEMPYAVLPFIGLGLAALLQGTFGLLPFWGDAWAFLFYVLLCIVCLVLGFAAASSFHQAPRDRDELTPFTLFAFTILICALASAAIALAQLFSLSEYAEWITRPTQLRRPGANIAQPNNLATLLVMGAASTVFLHRSGKFSGPTTALILLFIGAGIAVTESRAGALSVLVLLGWWFLKRRAIGDPTPRWVALGFGAVFVVIFWTWPYVLNALGVLDHHAEERMLEGSLRFQIWPQLLSALSIRPWTGWGIHQVTAALSAVTDRYAVSEPYTYSHNMILDLALWVGVPFALILVVATAFWTWRRARASNQLLPWYGLAIGVPLAVHSMLEYPYAYAYLLAPVMFMLGAVEASAGGGKPFLRIGTKSATAMLFVATAVLAWSVVEYLEIEEDFRVVRFQALRVGSPPPDHRPPTIILFDQLGGAIDAARITPTPNMSPRAMQVVKKAALHDPWTASQYRYAIALALNDDPTEAARQFRVIRLMRGERVYKDVKMQVEALAANKYPQLRLMNLP